MASPLPRLLCTLSVLAACGGSNDSTSTVTSGQAGSGGVSGEGGSASVAGEGGSLAGGGSSSGAAGIAQTGGNAAQPGTGCAGAGGDPADPDGIQPPVCPGPPDGTGFDVQAATALFVGDVGWDGTASPDMDDWQTFGFNIDGKHFTNANQAATHCKLATGGDCQGIAGAGGNGG